MLQVIDIKRNKNPLNLYIAAFLKSGNFLHRHKRRVKWEYFDIDSQGNSPSFEKKIIIQRLHLF